MGCSTSTLPEGFHSKYAISKKIPTPRTWYGNLPQIHLARRRKNSGTGEVAVKILSLRNRPSSSKRNLPACISAYKEVCLWSHIGNHPNCACMYEAFFDDHLCYMVMERCPKNLVDHVAGSMGFSERMLAEMFDQMLQGISHIHSLRILHQDINPTSFIVGGNDERTVKLTDFGMAVYLPEGKQVLHMSGTPPYISPEMSLNKGHGLKADMWSFGVIAYLLLCGNFPYTYDNFDPDKFPREHTADSIAECDTHLLSDRAISFLTELLKRDPDLRASADSARSMPYIMEKYNVEEGRFLPPLPKCVLVQPTDDRGNDKRSSTVDVILSEVQKGKLESNTRSLSQQHIDEFLDADPKMINRIVGDFWPAICTDIKPHVDLRGESLSTTCTSSTRSARSMSTSTNEFFGSI